MDVKFVGTLENEANICTKNLDGSDHTKFRERLRTGTLGMWLNYQLMTDPMPRREDVKQLKRVATLVQSIESNDDNDLNEDGEISENCYFNKRMKISW